MKLLLVSSLLLLVSLASAEPTPYITLLFKDGYVLSESHVPRKMSLTYTESMLQTWFLGLSRSYKVQTDKINLKRELLKKNEGFAIEAYLPGSNFGWNDCQKRSSEQLKALIYSCNGNVKLRLLTDEERIRIEKYQDEQKVSGKPFEVIYDHERVTTKSTEVDRFFYGDYDWDSHYYEVDCIVNSGKDRREIDFKHRLFDDSFVIEPTENDEGCGTTGLDGLDLHLRHCHGKIKVRHN